jgi:hypothetical protein
MELRREAKVKRGCGYRKVGGLYLVSDGEPDACGLLPRALDVCPTCSGGIKQSRGWQWVRAGLVFRPKDTKGCEACAGQVYICRVPWIAQHLDERIGLIWIGERHYKTPADFTAEARSMGISRRIGAVPRDLVLGETWVLLAHPKTIECAACHATGDALRTNGETGVAVTVIGAEDCAACKGKGFLPGVFGLFRPSRIEQIVTDTQALDAEFLADLDKRGITPVVVADDDLHHLSPQQIKVLRWRIKSDGHLVREDQAPREDEE